MRLFRQISTENDPGMSNRGIFVSWIPTVSGRLSFSEFGISDHPTDSVTTTFHLPDRKHFFSYQIRNCSDTTLPFLTQSDFIKEKIDNCFLKKSGQIVFVSQLSSQRIATQDRDPNDRLYGYVGLFTTENWKRLIRNRINRLRGEIERELNEGSNFLFAKTDFIKTIKENSDIYFNVEINRDGTTKLKNCMDHSHNKIYEIEDDEDLILQVYYYLKDNLHSHKHHSKSTDSIISVYKMESECDENWKIEILYSLYRKIISRRRKGGVEDFIDSIGVIAYAESFREIFNNYFKNNKSLSKYNTSAMLQSLNSSLRKAENEEKRNSKLEKLYVIYISTMAAIIAFASLVSASDKKVVLRDKILYDVTSAISNNPIETLSFSIFIFIAIYTIATKEKGRMKTYYFDIYRVLFPMKNYGVLVTLALGSVLIVLSSYLILRPVIKGFILQN